MHESTRRSYTNCTADLYQLLNAWWKGGQIGNGELPPSTFVPNEIDHIMLKLLRYDSVDELVKADPQSKIDRITEMLLGPNGLTVFKATIIQRENEELEKILNG